MCSFFLDFFLQLVDGLEQFSEEEGARRDTGPPQDTVDEDPDNLNLPRFRGPIAAAIGLVSRMANGLLGLRGNNKDAPHNRNGHGARTKHGLEEILGDDDSGSSAPYVVDRLRKRDTAAPGRIHFYFCLSFQPMIIRFVVRFR